MPSLSGVVRLVLALRTHHFFDKLCLDPLPDYSQVSEENTPGMIFQKVFNEGKDHAALRLGVSMAFP